MKKIILMIASAAALSLTALPTKAQSHLIKLTNHLEPYGFFRTNAIFDARDSKTDAEDLFFYLPYDKEINLEGDDIWFNPSIRMSAVTTRLGLNFTGFQFGALNVTGKVETDFSLNIGGSSSLRLREAYLKFNWDGLGNCLNSLSVKAGQSWHPMSEDMPYSVGYEIGSPFNPYSRSPQIMVEGNMFKGLSFTAGILYPMEFMPTGPQGPSADYVKYGLIPEMYAGVSYSSKHFTAKAGADVLSLAPRWRTTVSGYYYDKGTRVHDRLTMISPMVYASFNKGAFKINTKAVWASGGDHLGLMGGYAVYDRSNALDYKYTPLRSLTGFVSASYGHQWQYLLFVGGMKAFGTSKDLIADYETGFTKLDYIYYSEGGFKNIDSIMRVAPGVSYNLERLSFGLEYNFTGVVYGNLNELNARGLATMGQHLIVSHRILAMVRYSF